MRVVVTGHRGFVGMHLCRAIEGDGHQVAGLDIKDGNDILACDLPDADRVFHLAAQVDAQSEDVEADAAVNVMGTLRILRRYGAKVVHASSSMVNYPVMPYGISKLAAEHYARYFGAAVVRFCNLYGPGGHSAIDKFAEAGEITIFGSGEQVRTFAPVENAVSAMIDARPGRLMVLAGEDLTVKEIAGRHPGKPVSWRPARHLDILDGRQVA